DDFCGQAKMFRYRFLFAVADNRYFKDPPVLGEDTALRVHDAGIESIAFAPGWWFCWRRPRLCLASGEPRRRRCMGVPVAPVRYSASHYRSSVLPWPKGLIPPATRTRPMR